MMKIVKVLMLVTFITSTSFATEVRGNKRIVYKYKKYEKFDFEDMVIEGETGSPGDLSISPRYQRRFKNRLPYRKNFNAEIKKAVERIR